MRSLQFEFVHLPVVLRNIHGRARSCRDSRLQPIEGKRGACGLIFPLSIECGKMTGVWKEGDDNILTDGRHLTAAEGVIVITTDNRVSESRQNYCFGLISLPGNDHSRPHRCMGLVYGFVRVCPRPCPARKICAHLFCASKPGEHLGNPETRHWDSSLTMSRIRSFFAPFLTNGYRLEIRALRRWISHPIS